MSTAANGDNFPSLIHSARVSAGRPLTVTVVRLPEPKVIAPKTPKARKFFTYSMSRAMAGPSADVMIWRRPERPANQAASPSIAPNQMRWYVLRSQPMAEQVEKNKNHGTNDRRTSARCNSAAAKQRSAAVRYVYV